MNIKAFIISLIIPVLGGALSGFITSNSMDVYTSINLPAFAPPAWIFPIVWTILYVLMGISSYLIYTSGDSKQSINRALTIYAVQLVVNFIWPLLFFGVGNYLLAFIWIILLWVLIVITIYAFYQISKPAAYLMVPYLLWVTFAAYLNLSVYLLNR